MFDGFTKTQVETSSIAINLVKGGEGPPLLLLHGYPQTHVMWHKVAPIFAEHYTVVVPDLRGYGDSGKPASDDLDHHCKRASARDQVEVMEALGFDRFHVVGHDRGARVGHRMALDHPAQVRTFTSLDVVASQAAFENMDRDLAFSWFHWHLMRQPAPFPETLIGNSARLFLDFLLEQWTAVDDAIAPEAYAEYLRCFSDPETLHCMCMDYRAIALDLVTTRRTGAARSPARCWCSGPAPCPSAPAGRPARGSACWRVGASGRRTCKAGRLTAATSCPRRRQKRRRGRF